MNILGIDHRDFDALDWFVVVVIALLGLPGLALLIGMYTVLIRAIL